MAMMLRTHEFRAASLRLVQSSRFARQLARWLVLLLTVCSVAMFLLPWQQTARGTGVVTARDPQQRQQRITAQFEGVVLRIMPGLMEGTIVSAGDVILEIQPNAENLVEQTRGQLKDLEEKLRTAESKVAAYDELMQKYTKAAEFTESAANEMVRAAEEKLAGKQLLVPGYESKEWQARVNYERQAELAEKGLRSSKDLEYLKKDWEVAKSELEGIKRDVESLRAEVAEKEQKREEMILKARAEVDYYRAQKEDSAGQAATAGKELKELEAKLSEFDRLVVKAPCDGRIFRLFVFEQGQQLKKGDDLFTIVPTTTDLAVELWLRGMDTPLVRTGDEVRLQFDGWPAVQFVGWPSVAVGTFGGQVSAIDPTDDGTGRFRILIQPLPNQPWPSEQYLRQGVQANGWVMLDEVTLAFELWRQLNGFPLTVSKGDDSDKTKSDASKLIKP